MKINNAIILSHQILTIFVVNVLSNSEEIKEKEAIVSSEGIKKNKQII